MEAVDLAHDDQTRKSVVLRRLEEFVLKPDLDTRTAFDKLVLDRKRIQTAVAQCGELSLACSSFDYLTPPIQATDVPW